MRKGREKKIRSQFPPSNPPSPNLREKLELLSESSSVSSKQLKASRDMLLPQIPWTLKQELATGLSKVLDSWGSDTTGSFEEEEALKSWDTRDVRSFKDF